LRAAGAGVHAGKTNKSVKLDFACPK